MTPAQWSLLMRDPATPKMLSDMVADNRRIDAQLVGVPESIRCQFCDQPQWFVQQGIATTVYRCENGHASAVSR